MTQELCKCGVPNRVHGTMCGWESAILILNPKDDTERNYQEMWLRAKNMIIVGNQLLTASPNISQNVIKCDIPVSGGDLKNDYEASDNATMKPSCDAPFKDNNSIEHSAYNLIQDIDLLLDQMPHGKERVWNEIEKKIELFLRQNPPQETISTCPDCGQYILFDPTTNETKCICKKWQNK